MLALPPHAVAQAQLASQSLATPGFVSVPPLGGAPIDDGEPSAEQFSQIAGSSVAQNAHSPFEINYQPSTGDILIRDPINGAIIMNTTGINHKSYDTSWDFRSAKNETPLPAENIQFIPQPNGYDLEVTVTNNATEAGRVGTIFAYGMRLASSVQYRSFNYFQVGDRLNQAQMNHVGYWLPFISLYPGGESYSPLIYLQGNATAQNGDAAEYGIGVSLQYPVLEYGTVGVALQGVSGTWRVVFYNNPRYRSTTGPCGPNDPPCGDLISPRYIPEDDIKPGERRTYRMSVRIMRNPSSYPEIPYEWLRLFDPYREYFQKLYGMPRYRVDHRPMAGVGLSIQHMVSPTNPWGFMNPRLDTEGWAPIVNDLRRLRDQQGWSRQVLWAPTGINPVDNFSTNFRHEFTSRWQDLDAVRNSMNILEDFAADGTLGLWWGRTTRVSTEGWENATSETFDQRSPRLRALSFKEMEGAKRVNATVIGLDEFILPSHRNFTWLNELRLRYPNMSFSAEAFQSDIIHVLAANFKALGAVPETTDQTACTDGRPLILPLALPDFLLRHHETWGYGWISWINGNACQPVSVHASNTPATLYWPQYVAAQGFVPVLSISSNSPQQILTQSVMDSFQPGFIRSVPQDLQEPYAIELAEQPTSATAECGDTVTLSAEPRPNTLVSPASYQWYFRAVSIDPANDTLPDDLANGFLSPVSNSDWYQGAATKDLNVVIHPSTIGTYALLITASNGARTWSSYVSVDGQPSGEEACRPASQIAAEEGEETPEEVQAKRRRSLWKRLFR